MTTYRLCAWSVTSVSSLAQEGSHQAHSHLALHNLAPAAQMQSGSIGSGGTRYESSGHRADIATPNAGLNAIEEVAVTVGEEEPPPQNPPPMKAPPPYPSIHLNMPPPFPKSGKSSSPVQPLAVTLAVGPPPFKAPPLSSAAMAPPMTFAIFQGWLQGRKANGKTWSTILRQHQENSCKPTREGGQQGAPCYIFSSHRCFIDDVPCPCHNGIHHFCVLELESSFLPHDCRRVYGTGRGATDEDALDAAGLEVLAKLLCQSPFQVWLLDEDWIGGPATFIQEQATLQGQTMGWATPTKAHPVSH